MKIQRPGTSPSEDVHSEDLADNATTNLLHVPPDDLIVRPSQPHTRVDKMSDNDVEIARRPTHKSKSFSGSRTTFTARPTDNTTDAAGKRQTVSKGGARNESRGAEQPNELVRRHTAVENGGSGLSDHKDVSDV